MEYTPVTPRALNDRINREIHGFTFNVVFWYSKDGTYVEPPDWSEDMCAALSLLDKHSWSLGTCDMGHACRIYTAPEHGSDLIGEGCSDTPAQAICLAVLDANGKKGLK